METAIIGLPLAGKTTLFNALTGMNARLSTHSGGKREVNLADVPVPDGRVDRLSEVFGPKSTAYATVRFKDVPVDFTTEGGISARTIAELRGSDALTIVIRTFEEETVPHPLESIDPERDFRNVIESLILSDFAVADKRLERLTKEGRRADREYVRLEKILERLGEGEILGEGLDLEDRKLFSGFAFLTAKPLIVVANTGESAVDERGLTEAVAERDLPLFVLQGQLELEIASLPPGDQREFLDHLGLEESVSRRFLQTIYERLDLLSFLTAGEDEVRAWSIARNTPAAEAAGRIHSDLQKGFIRAEVVRWDDLAEAGGFREAKAANMMRLEGKDYLVQDGDVLTIRFNL
jgi:GTP-binding protein YchF